MGRPKPNPAEPGYDAGGVATGQTTPPAPYPPPVQEAVQYPPPPPSVVSGTPVHQSNFGSALPYQQQHIGDPWSSGLFACDLNETNAVMTAFFPCATFGQIAEILDEGQTSCPLGGFMYVLTVPAVLSCWVLGSNYRKKLRQKYNLVEAPYEDWAVHLFCPCCALCQEFRELEKRGFDPSKGWMGHLANQRAMQTTPPMDQFMTKD